MPVFWSGKTGKTDMHEKECRAGEYLLVIAKGAVTFYYCTYVERPPLFKYLSSASKIWNTLEDTNGRSPNQCCSWRRMELITYVSRQPPRQPGTRARLYKLMML